MSLRELTRLNTDKDVEQQELSFIAGGVQKVSDFERQFLTKLNILLPYDPALVLLGADTRGADIRGADTGGVYTRGLIPEGFIPEALIPEGSTPEG